MKKNTHAKKATKTSAEPRSADFRASAVETAWGLIGKLEPGCRVIGITAGQFSLLDLVRAVMRSTGPADVWISSWTIGTRDAENVAWLIEQGQIEDFRIILDRGFPAVKPEPANLVEELFGSAITLAQIHAKFVLIRTEKFDLTIRTSMNLNRNPRFEMFEIDDDPHVSGFFRDFYQHVCDTHPSGLRASSRETSTALEQSLDGADGPRLMSVKQYAEHRGCSRSAVYKALDEGRCPRTSDGKIDAVVADRRWEERTRAKRAGGKVTRTRTRSGVDVDDADNDEEVTLHEARVRKEHALAQLTEMKLEKEREQLVRMDDVRRVWDRELGLLRTRLETVRADGRSMWDEVPDLWAWLATKMDESLAVQPDPGEYTEET